MFTSTEEQDEDEVDHLLVKPFDPIAAQPKKYDKKGSSKRSNEHGAGSKKYNRSNCGSV